MRIANIVGTRPQLIKAAALQPALRAQHDEVFIDTGQHWDDGMAGVFFRELGLRAPDHSLGVGGGTAAEQTGAMLVGLERTLRDVGPEVAVIYGDTNSTLAAAVVTCKLAYADGYRPWLAHVEAGLRSFNRRMPEERNRIVADHLSDMLLAPTATAMAHLAREGLGACSELVGDVMVDAHAWAIERAEAHVPAAAREHDRYVLLTMHRAENVDDPRRFMPILEGLAIDLPVIFPVHPRTRAVLERGAHGLPGNVIPIAPVGYLEMVALESRAHAIATDSGGVQKEAYLSGVPCITLRSETEWVETVEAGWNRVVDADPTALGAALADETFMSRDRPRPQLYGDGNAATRIVAALERHHARATGREPEQEETAP
jgi:UDP-GlcNAc3NAcA epimerase